MFWFLLLGLLLVVGAVTLAVSGSGVGRGGDRVVGGLAGPVPERLAAALPPDRPLARADVDALRLPLALRGYRMDEVDDVLDRLSAELSERDARIAELEAALAGAQAGAVGSGDLLAKGDATPEDLPRDDVPHEGGQPGDELLEDAYPSGERPGAERATDEGAADDRPDEQPRTSRDGERGAR